MSAGLVVAGTDTDVGKTVFAASLVAALGACYWKPVQCGLADETDAEVVARLAGVVATRILPEVYRLNTPASPHLAAERDGLEIDVERLVPPASERPLVVEPAGGLMVPLTRRLLQIDLIARWHMPVVLCASTRLGTINHSLLSIEALKRRAIPLIGIAFVGAEQSDFRAHDCPDGQRPPTRAAAAHRSADDCDAVRGLRAELRRGRFSRGCLLMSGRPTSPIWHPFTQHALQPQMLEVARADGAWLETPGGRRILDAISSWWVVTHGHRHPHIIAAIKAEADRLDQVIFAGFTHAPAERLARGLLAVAPPGLAHVFFSDSGSTAVEVALKMALGYWRNIGEPRHRILALEHAYHGDTIGGMSVGARSVFNAPYEPLLFEVGRIPFPLPGHEQDLIDVLEAVCAEGDVAALILEPLILGAGGMLIYSPDALLQMQRVCERHGVLLIADEVMTGWGRTGTLFACEQAAVAPDILCLAKGLTGGALPLAVTLCSGPIFELHLSPDRTRTFFHSSSYTANPIACAAALANLEVWEDEPVSARIAALAEHQADRLVPFLKDGRFKNVRQLGTIAALDLDVPDGGYLAGIGPKLYDMFLERGVLLRPLGNTIYVMPPYCITAEELDLVYAAIDAAAAAVGG